MDDKDKSKYLNYGFQPIGEQNGFQPTGNKPESSNNDNDHTIQSNGNVSQNK